MTVHEAALEAFDELILELTNRKHYWTAEERKLYERCLRRLREMDV